MLKNGVALYKGKGWARVAQHVGHGLTAQQCSVRWNDYLSKVQQGGIKQGNWTDEEVEVLKVAAFV